MRIVQHPCVPRVLEVAVGRKRESVFIAMELFDTDLAKVLDARGVGFPEPQVKRLAMQLLDALREAHARYVLHRDVKMSNLLYSSGKLGLTDFGLARQTPRKRGADMSPGVVTLWYRPPEVLLGGRQYGPAVDVWGAGCVLAELLVGEPLAPGRDEAHQLALYVELLGHPEQEGEEKEDGPGRGRGAAAGSLGLADGEHHGRSTLPSTAAMDGAWAGGGVGVGAVGTTTAAGAATAPGGGGTIGTVASGLGDGDGYGWRGALDLPAYARLWRAAQPWVRRARERMGTSGGAGAGAGAAGAQVGEKRKEAGGGASVTSATSMLYRPSLEVLLRGHCSEECVRMLRGLLHWDPAKRLSAAAALDHPWFSAAPPACPLEEMPSSEVAASLGGFGAPATGATSSSIARPGASAASCTRMDDGGST